MKLLHTSDWHIGRHLYGRKRYEEFEAFLNWLLETIEREQVEVLLVAGDIFDTSAPSNRAQQLYYNFLCRVAGSCCRHIVLIAGNHDSPSFLNAPRQLLRALNVQVIGALPESREDEVFVLDNAAGEPGLIVCAVPYLRDRDIRVAEAGETLEDKERKLLDGIRSHYAETVALAQQKRAALGAEVPIVGMGHLFAAGGKTVDGDGVRDLYVGSLAHVSGSIFPQALDYVALGHLHVPQCVGGSEAIRYCGSPIPMGFGEARQQKLVCLVDFEHDGSAHRPRVELVNVPVFQKLERITGDWELISARLLELADEQDKPWLEIVYEGEMVASDLREWLDVAAAQAGVDVLRVRNNRIMTRSLVSMNEDETLDDLDVDEVFERCLSAHEVPAEQRPELLRAYRETLASLHDDDSAAE